MKIFPSPDRSSVPNYYGTRLLAELLLPFEFRGISLCCLTSCLNFHDSYRVVYSRVTFVFLQFVQYVLQQANYFKPVCLSLKWIRVFGQQVQYLGDFYPLLSCFIFEKCIIKIVALLVYVWTSAYKTHSCFVISAFGKKFK